MPRSEAMIKRLAEVYLEKARKNQASETASKRSRTISGSFRRASAGSSRTGWRPSRAISRPCKPSPSGPTAVRCRRRSAIDITAFYRSLRDSDGLSHEDAVRDTLVSVLMSPHFCYRVDLPGTGAGIRPLSDYALASRLSYFLWSSMPDDELLAHAAAGDLHRPEVLVGAGPADAPRRPRPRAGDRVRRQLARLPPLRGAQQRRPRAVSRPSTTTCARRCSRSRSASSSIWSQSDRPVLDFLDAEHTFVNPVLAKHYGMPAPRVGPDEMGTGGRRARITAAAACCRWRCF